MWAPYARCIQTCQTQHQSVTQVGLPPHEEVKGRQPVTTTTSTRTMHHVDDTQTSTRAALASAFYNKHAHTHTHAAEIVKVCVCVCVPVGREMTSHDDLTPKVQEGTASTRPPLMCLLKHANHIVEEGKYPQGDLNSHTLHHGLCKTSWRLTALIIQ